MNYDVYKDNGVTKVTKEIVLKATKFHFKIHS